MASLSDTDNMDHSHNEKPSSQVHQVGDLKTMDTLDNLVYNDAEEEPELHMRTYIALAAMFLLSKHPQSHVHLCIHTRLEFHFRNRELLRTMLIEKRMVKR
jgi:hypothetical protein